MMVKNEVKIYDSKIELPPIAAAGGESSKTALNLPLDKIELNSCSDSTEDKKIVGFVWKRKFKRTKSSGIF